MTELEEINDLSFEQEVLESRVPFLLDFTAAWCGPCKRLTPILRELAAEESGRFRVGKIDLEQSPLTAQRLGVRAAPTLVVYCEGVEVARRVGLLSKARLKELVLGEG